MRKFVKSHRLQADSVPDLTQDFEAATLRLSHQLKFDGRKLRPGPVLNAVILWFVGLPEDERLAMAEESLVRLEAYLSETDEEREQAQSRLLSLTARPANSGAAVRLSAVIESEEVKRARGESKGVG